MLLVQAAAQNLRPLALKLEPQLLLTLLVALLFLILVVIGVLSRSRRLRHRGQELEDHNWRKVLLQRFAEMDEKSSSSE